MNNYNQLRSAVIKYFSILDSDEKTNLKESEEILKSLVGIVHLPDITSDMVAKYYYRIRIPFWTAMEGSSEDILYYGREKLPWMEFMNVEDVEEHLLHLGYDHLSDCINSSNHLKFLFYKIYKTIKN